jgi:ferric-dicitrate binding protein FerR (iron transport regulator)
MNEHIRGSIFQLIDGTISDQDFERLQEAIEADSSVREEYLRAVGLNESLQELAIDSAELSGNEKAKPAADAPSSVQSSRKSFLLAVALVLVVVIVVGDIGFWIYRANSTDQPETLITDREDETTQTQIAGHATLRRAVDVEWPDEQRHHLEGDVLPNGLLKFDVGLAEIDFFCGATLIVEGPATLDIESDWSVRVLNGRLRATVPPAARGFIVKAADSEIIDLGTEFALNVSPEHARLEVIDGEVEIRGGHHDGKHLLTGHSELLKGEEAPTNIFQNLTTASELQQHREKANQEVFARWQNHSQELRNDERLIAYYPITDSQQQRAVENAADSGSGRDGLVVGPVAKTNGRFGQESTGLQFDRHGARVRTRIDGEFQAFSFACWVRIDSLEHRYSALFMGDGYENGEPHWQIRDDGRLMFSVMVDDSKEINYFSKLEQKMVIDAGLHRVYLTEPIWDLTKSGKWFHLAAVYDPKSRRVAQYVDGQLVSEQEIEDKYHISTLRIGPAEIGNWGQPFRKTPVFSVRNLNGTIDELAIFNAALTTEEIHHMYEMGKPLGY